MNDQVTSPNSDAATMGPRAPQTASSPTTDGDASGAQLAIEPVANSVTKLFDSRQCRQIHARAHPADPPNVAQELVIGLHEAPVHEVVSLDSGERVGEPAAAGDAPRGGRRSRQAP